MSKVQECALHGRILLKQPSSIYVIAGSTREFMSGHPLPETDGNPVFSTGRSSHEWHSHQPSYSQDGLRWYSW